MLRAAGFGFFGGSSSQQWCGEWSVSPWGPPFPHSWLLPSAKDQRNFSVRAERPTPSLWQEWGTLSFSFFSPEQEPLRLGLWGWEDPLAQGMPAWNNPCPWRPAWQGRASLAPSMAPKSFGLAQESHPGMIHGPRSWWLFHGPGHGPQPTLTCQHGTIPPFH